MRGNTLFEANGYMYVHTFIFLLSLAHKLCGILCVRWETAAQYVGLVPHLELKTHWAPTGYFLVGLNELTT